MSYDYVNELGHLALGTRLKRISEAISHSNRQLYRYFDFEIEPNWFLVLKMLKKYEKLTVMDITKKLHFAHPTVISMLGRMKDKGFLTEKKDKKDARKHYYMLSQKSIDRFPEWDMVWEASMKSIGELLPENSRLMVEIELIEVALFQKNLKERTLEALNKDNIV